MRITFLEDATIEAMGRYMSRLTRRQQVIASNIANIETPGYRTKEVSFHATMDELLGVATQLRSRRPEHFAPPLWRVGAAPEVLEPSDAPVRPDGNNVDLDREMLKLGETSFGYSLAAQLLRAKFRTLASSINEGRIA